MERFVPGRHRGRGLALAIVLAATTSGCFAGYDFVRYEGALGDVRTVAIYGFENKSYEAGVDAIMTEALMREFLRRGALRIVDDPAVADLVLRGAVEEVKIQGRSFSSVQFALEYAVTVRLSMEATRPDGTEVPIAGRAIQETELALVTADVEVNRTHREQAIRRVADSLAGRIHDSLFIRQVP